MEPPRLEWAADWLKTSKTSFVDGAWIGPSATSHETINPANGRVLGSVRYAATNDIDRAVDAARAAFAGRTWQAMSRRERAVRLRQIGEVVRAHCAELATLIALENGKLYREAYDDDMPDTADVFDYYAGWTDKLYGETCPVDGDFINYTARVPVGVCGLIAPWNFPLLLAAWKLAPALAMGNTVVIKPSEFTSYSLVRFVELVQEHVDLPSGVINLVLGAGAVGEMLTAHPRVDKISFTGSTAVGRRILHNAADSNLKTVTLELGGKSPNVIFDDVPDMDFAIDRSFTLMFAQKGEKCSEPTRFLIHERIYERFVAALVAKAQAVVCGDPFDPASDQGPQCNRPQFDKILRYVDIGKAEGARLLVGGERDVSRSNAAGFFVRPTIFEADNSMQVARDEIFGPVLAVMPFRDEAEAVRLANDTPYGLAAGVWSNDVARAHRVANQLDAGMVFINRYGCYDFASPFGGLKQSGWGKEMASHSLESYTKLKSIWVTL
ncbi:MAG TPA: aldehyde dehydrogenase family protein [Candidatus Binatia bacterium]|nr:aldehyde dehydrogenase family protein [Candidatus Binatia bacterium]